MQTSGSARHQSGQRSGSQAIRRYGKTPSARPTDARVSVGFEVVSVELTSPKRMPSVRRLTAILAADVAGYSRLMGADEEGTHERLKAHLRELVDPKIAEHRGRIVKNTGDGLLGRVRERGRRRPLRRRGAAGDGRAQRGHPDEKRIEFRIGINLGDVIAEEHDIFGDGVNVAARLEALAEPGGICVSRVVRDQVRDKLDFAFEDMGEQQVKNIARPVRVYRVRDQAVPAKEPAPASPQPLPLPDKPSIAVLPFANMSSDPEQEFFADGIAEDVITALSRYPSLVRHRPQFELHLQGPVRSM